MPDLPELPSSEVLRVLELVDFVNAGERANHVKVRGPRGPATVSVIIPKGERLPRGVLASILRQAGMNREDFLDLV